MKKLLKRVSCIAAAAVLACSTLISASAKSNHLNIEVYMDKSFINKNGLPGAFQTRYPELTNAIKSFYNVKFGIELDFHYTLDNAHMVTSAADSCEYLGASNYMGICGHFNDVECLSGKKLHHNYSTVMRNALPSSSSDTARLLLTSHIICYKSGIKHSTAYGICWKSNKQLISMDYDSKNVGDKYYKDNMYTRMTLVHEIGHLYEAPDHYNDPKSNPNCIWGANRRTPEISKQLIVCDDCLAKIKANKGLYNYT